MSRIEESDDRRVNFRGAGACDGFVDVKTRSAFTEPGDHALLLLQSWTAVHDGASQQPTRRPSELDEREAMQAWRQLFRGDPVSDHTIAEAESLIDQLHPESPVRVRFSKELDEVRKLLAPPKPKKKR